jgi:hypothetical protein
MKRLSYHSESHPGFALAALDEWRSDGDHRFCDVVIKVDGEETCRAHR